jgi:hypothetical protein
MVAQDFGRFLKVIDSIFNIHSFMGKGRLV